MTLLLFVLAERGFLQLEIPAGRSVWDEVRHTGFVPLLICLDLRQTARLTRRDVWTERATLRFGPELHGSKFTNRQSVRRVVGESLVVV